MIALLAGGGMYVYTQMMRYVDIPDVRDMPQSEATALLTEEDLVVSTITQAWHDSIQAGNVISANPQQNTRVERDSNVELIVSNGKEQVEIGNYIGQEYEPIRSQLRTANFIVERRDIASSPEEEGLILDQSVAPGTKVIPGETDITLIVGIYSESVTMQDFYNLSYDMVENFGLAYGVNIDVTYDYSDFIPEGQVISQSPSSGTPLVPGDSVSVIVSQGPEEEEIVSASEYVYVEYVPTYADSDDEQLEPLPNQVEIYLGDSQNNINTIAYETTITKSSEILLTLYIPTNGTGQYRVLRDGEIVSENYSVYPN